MRGMTPTAKEDFVRILVHVAEHPQNYRDVIPNGHERTFFAGLDFSLRLFLGLAYDARRERELRHAAAELRGFDSSRHPVEQMLERGLLPDAVLSELSRLEIEFIQLAVE